MEIEVNGDKREIESGLTLAQMLQDMNVVPVGTAVAVDSAIVPKGSWAEFKLAAGMKVDIFSLVAGG